MNEKLKYFLLYASIFVWSSVVITTPIEIYSSYLVIAVFFPIFALRFGLPKPVVYIFFPLLVFGLIDLYLQNNSSSQFFKIFVGLLISSIFYYYVIAEQQFDIKKIFQHYTLFGYWVSLIGCFQLFSFLIGFSPGYSYGWLLNKWGLSLGGAFGLRVNSVMSEPAYIAATLSPLFLVALNNLLRKQTHFLNRKKSLVVIACYLLTFSSVGTSAIFLALILLFSNYGFFKYVVVAAPALLFGYNFAYQNIPEFRERLDGASYLFSTGDAASRDVHGSSFVLYNHYHIAVENWKRNPLVGTGLGSHETAFDKYSLTKQTGTLKIEFNKADANSMFLRTLSETGLMGIGFLVYLIVRFYVPRRKSVDDIHWLLSNALLLIILTYLLRQGHYFYSGFPFFVWLYYFVWKSNKATFAAQLEEGEEVDEEVSSQTPLLEA